MMASRPVANATLQCSIFPSRMKGTTAHKVGKTECILLIGLLEMSQENTNSFFCLTSGHLEKKLFTVSVYARGLTGPVRVKFDQMV